MVKIGAEILKKTPRGLPSTLFHEDYVLLHREKHYASLKNILQNSVESHSRIWSTERNWVLHA